MEDEWLTLAEAAERLGIPVQTVRRWARDGNAMVSCTLSDAAARPALSFACGPTSYPPDP